ncbi:hypothetical protein E6P78_00425 [Streptomyces sp. A0958]|uniref:hypothetical protein n=1 Tax=Streptomyces sp. A0958 TaxID=2563101 RepID=UPI00109E40BD|nr:hypothetical protein [Streptomyces sp. A0958]THA72662.1 hypothetical protein E6P78_00425 [Streptomyces sp. A0958]
MGIESDQLVYDYLSRIGDLAQQQQLSSGTRMRLVSELRGEIERQRRAQAADTPGAVRRIIGALGTPDELVEAASRTGVAAPVPQAREEDRPEATGIPGPRRPKLRRKDLLRKGASQERKPAPAPPQTSAPHRAGTDELSPDGGETEWWRVEPGPFDEFGAGTEVPGFRGGIEIPALLRPPAPEEEAEDEEPEAFQESEVPEDEEAALPERRRRRWLPKVSRRSRSTEAAAPASRRGFSHPLLLLAAALLVTGAVMGSLLALGGGWLLAYGSRKLSRAEAKWAALGLPGVVAAGAAVWLWGRMEGRWGAPIPEHGMADALSDVWPVTIRTAAVASAVFLVWRARRG